MKTYRIEISYTIELNARDKEQAKEMAWNCFDNAMNNDGYNCLETDVEEVQE